MDSQTQAEVLGSTLSIAAVLLIGLCIVGWKRGWIYVEGESGFQRPGAFAAVAV
jgi:hypothetical protein